VWIIIAVMVETQKFDREDNGYFAFTSEIFKSVRDFVEFFS